jgi:trypsin-like peptidase
MPGSFNQCPGSAPEGQWWFEDSEGNRLNGGEATISILEELGHNRYQFIATGFFIADSGLFVTAKHVLESFSPERLVAWQFLPDNEYLPRPILAFSCHETCDVAVGQLVPAVNPTSGELLINNKHMLTTVPPPVGEHVATFAYPNTVIEPTEIGQRLQFNPDFYEGLIEEYFPNGVGLLRGPCYRTSMQIYSGASGGPVASPSRPVFAVNSTGMNGIDVSHVSRIDEILSLSLTLNYENGQEVISITELSQNGQITFDPPLTKSSS